MSRFAWVDFCLFLQGEHRTQLSVCVSRLGTNAASGFFFFAVGVHVYVHLLEAAIWKRGIAWTFFFAWFSCSPIFVSPPWQMYHFVSDRFFVAR